MLLGELREDVEDLQITVDPLFDLIVANLHDHFSAVFQKRTMDLANRRRP